MTGTVSKIVFERSLKMHGKPCRYGVAYGNHKSKVFRVSSDCRRVMSMPTPKKAASAKSALSKPVQPDAALAAVVGKDPLPRTELTKKLWEYIRKHELQDPNDKRNVRADEKLLAVFDGKKVVSMFEMTKLVNGTLCEQDGL